MNPANKKTTHLEFLDVLRGVAILWVFLAHSTGISYALPPWGKGWVREFAGTALPALMYPLTYGTAGVAVFFVVSGFCIHLSYLRGRPGDWRGFFVRRFFRIYPPYLVALAWFAFCFPKSRLAFGVHFPWGLMLSHLFLVHNFNPDWYYGINGAFWSIAVESQLYVLYPVLVALASRRGWPLALCLTGALEIGLRAWSGVVTVEAGGREPLWLVGLPVYYWFSWTVGAALADAYVRGTALPFASWPLWPCVALAMAAPPVKYAQAFAFPFFAVATVIVMARQLRDATAPERAPWVPAVVTAHLRRLGVWSYALYLLHEPVLRLLWYVPLKIPIPAALQHPWANFVACLGLYPFIVAVSVLFRRYVELPSIAWGKLTLRQA